jgi:hypothetical protein
LSLRSAPVARALNRSCARPIGRSRGVTRGVARLIEGAKTYDT